MEYSEARNKAKQFMAWYENNEEAIKAVLKNTQVEEVAAELFEVVKKLHEVTYKESMMKPREQRILGMRYNCPMCDYTLVNHSRYCGNCGQAISWERWNKNN